MHRKRLIALSLSLVCLLSTPAMAVEQTNSDVYSLIQTQATISPVGEFWQSLQQINRKDTATLQAKVKSQPDLAQALFNELAVAAYYDFLPDSESKKWLADLAQWLPANQGVYDRLQSYAKEDHLQASPLYTSQSQGLESLFYLKEKLRYFETPDQNDFKELSEEAYEKLSDAEKENYAREFSKNQIDLQSQYMSSRNDLTRQLLNKAKQLGLVDAEIILSDHNSDYFSYWQKLGYVPGQIKHLIALMKPAEGERIDTEKIEFLKEEALRQTKQLPDPEQQFLWQLNILLHYSLHYQPEEFGELWSRVEQVQGQKSEGSPQQLFLQNLLATFSQASTKEIENFSKINRQNLYQKLNPWLDNPELRPYVIQVFAHTLDASQMEVVIQNYLTENNQQDFFTETKSDRFLLALTPRSADKLINMALTSRQQELQLRILEQINAQDIQLEMTTLKQLAPLLVSKDEEMALTTRYIFQESKQPRASQFVIPMLKDQQGNVNNDLFDLLSSFKDQESLPQILPLFKNANSDLKIALLKLLAELGASEHSKYFLAYASDPDSAVREQALLGLVRSGTHDQHPVQSALLNQLQKTAQASFKEWLRDPEGYPDMIILVSNWKDELVQRGYDQSKYNQNVFVFWQPLLQKLKPEEQAVLITALIRDYILDSSFDLNQLKPYLLNTLKQNLSPQIKTRLLQDLQAEKLFGLENKMANVFCNWGEEAQKTVQNLRKQNHAPLVSITNKIMIQCEFEADSASLKNVLADLANTDPEIYSPAITYLGNQKQFSYLESALKSSDALKRLTILKNLPIDLKQKHSQTFDALLQAKDLQIKIEAFKLLMDLGPELLPHIKALLNDQNPYLKLTAARFWQNNGGDPNHLINSLWMNPEHAKSDLFFAHKINLTPKPSHLIKKIHVQGLLTELDFNLLKQSGNVDGFQALVTDYPKWPAQSQADFLLAAKESLTPTEFRSVIPTSLLVEPIITFLQNYTDGKITGEQFYYQFSLVFETLSKLEDKRILEPLMAYYPKASKLVSSQLIELMASLDYEAAKPILLQNLKSKNQTIRSSAIRILSMYEEPEIIQAIHQELKARNLESDWYLNQDLLVGNPLARDLFKQMQQNPLPANLQDTLASLLNSDHPFPIDAENVKSMVIALGDARLEPVLMNLMQDPNPSVRWRVADILAGYAGPQHRELIRQQLTDRDKDVKENAIKILVDLKDYESREAIRKQPLSYPGLMALQVLGSDTGIMDEILKNQPGRLESKELQKDPESFYTILAPHLALTADSRWNQKLIQVLDPYQFDLLAADFLKDHPLEAIFYSGDVLLQINLQISLLQVFAESSDTRLVERIYPFLNASDSKLCLVALQVLRRIGDRNTQPLLRLVNHPDPAVQSELRENFKALKVSPKTAEFNSHYQTLNPLKKADFDLFLGDLSLLQGDTADAQARWQQVLQTSDLQPLLYWQAQLRLSRLEAPAQAVQSLERLYQDIRQTMTSRGDQAWKLRLETQFVWVQKLLAMGQTQAALARLQAAESELALTQRLQNGPRQSGKYNQVAEGLVASIMGRSQADWKPLLNDSRVLAEYMNSLNQMAQKEADPSVLSDKSKQLFEQHALPLTPKALIEHPAYEAYLAAKAMTEKSHAFTR